MPNIMAVVEGLFRSGHVVDIALAVIAMEFAFLYLRTPARQRAKALPSLIYALGPGVCLMLALRAALTGSGVLVIAAWLAASFPLHILDLSRRRL